MPKVNFRPPDRELGNSPVTFKVGDPNRGVIGTLEIRKGRVVWKDAHSQKGYKMSWETFAELMATQGDSK